MSRDLLSWLEEAQTRGLIGPRELPSAIQHARELGVFALQGFTGTPRGLDIGSGGGLPGLVLANDWPAWEWTLLDSNRRSTAFLSEAARDLGLAVQVASSRVEEFALEPGVRGSFGLVVARSVAALAVVCEYAAPLLEVGGRLVVSQPPQAEPVSPAVLDRLGMELEAQVGPPSAAILRQERPCPPEFPRRTGVAVKRPLG